MASYHRPYRDEPTAELLRVVAHDPDSLSDPDFWRWRYAAWELAHREERLADAPMLAALASADIDIQMDAVGVLVQLQAVQAIPALEGLTESAPEPLLTYVHEALDQLRRMEGPLG